SHTLEPTMREVLGCGHEAISRAWITGRPLPFSPPRTDEGERSIPQILEDHRLSPEVVAELVDPRRAPVRPAILRPLLHGPIDADRIDYLQRDAHYTGVAHGVIDANRLLETFRERKGRVVFAEKGRTAVEGFLV